MDQKFIDCPGGPQIRERDFERLYREFTNQFFSHLVDYLAKKDESMTVKDFYMLWLKKLGCVENRGGKFYDLLGNLLGLEEAFAREAFGCFVIDLYALEADVEKEFNLPFNEIKRLAGKQFQDECGDDSEARMLKLYQRSRSDLNNEGEWPYSDVRFIECRGQNYRAVFIGTFAKTRERTLQKMKIQLSRGELPYFYTAKEATDS